MLRKYLGTAGLVIALAMTVAWAEGESANGGRWEIFSAATPGCAVIVPAQPSEAELRAAALVSATLAAAAGRDAFTVVREGGAGGGRGLFVGETRFGMDGVTPLSRRQPLDDVFTLRVTPDGVTLRSARCDAIEAAAAWFLEKNLGAHWFMPGKLGVQVPRRSELQLALGEQRVWPGFFSRSLGVDAAWAAANKLEARLEHGHSYARIFTRKDLLENPLLTPMRAGTRFLPTKDGEQGWQPDLTSPAAVVHAADFINRELDKNPTRDSFPLCQNDSVRYDDSAATLARVSPLHYFRRQPDYTPLVFRFTNEVADAVRNAHPDKWITAYAYDWTENAPNFRVAPNVVPFLTADRSQWFEPEFAAEDRATMAAWVRSGARLVGTYDYYEGAPFLVPRPTLYAVAAIPEIFAAGVRAFYGEGAPNWGLDGPKAWLAAQLLWDPRLTPAELLDVYYREFWQEAAEPMRAFYACAERAWLGQPHPGYWIKYYMDEHQSLLFPAALRSEMRGCLTEAARAAASETVRARVAFVAEAFAVSEAFVGFCEVRDALTRATANLATDETQLIHRLQEFLAAREKFLRLHAALRKSQPLAIQTNDLAIYLRNDPSGAARLRLSQSALGRRRLAEEMMQPVQAETTELLANPSWTGIEIGPIGGSTSFEWAGAAAVGQWRGHGDPFETRSVTWTAEDTSGRAARFAGCKQETLSQVVDGVIGDRTYVARARVRARVSPGTSTFLILTFFDEKFQAFELGHTCRLPAGETDGWQEIAVVATAPEKARYVGFGVRVINQVNDDFADFRDVSLRTARAIPP